MGAIQSAIAILRGVLPATINIEYSPQVESVMGMSVEELWRTQPYLRTLVTFLARNIAQLPVKSYERVSDNDRQRVLDDPLTLLLKRPNDHMTTYELFFALVADKALYNEAFWLLYVDGTSPSGWGIEPISPGWVLRRGGESAFKIDWIEFQRPTGGIPVRISVENLIVFPGWNAGRPRATSSPVEALRQILAEQISSATYREQKWRRGGRIGGFLTRPAGAKWDRKTREKFQRDWAAKFTGQDGSQAGGTPLLEDGMTYSNAYSFSAEQDQFVDVAKLSFATVASVYHVNPTMVGLLDNANFSNVVQFRQMLYGDTLGSTIAEIEDRLNTFLVPQVSKIPDLYVEFDFQEKLRGSFTEQLTAMQSAVGAPFILRDEARAMFNLPQIPGADQLVVPLNVLVGGQASAQDSGSQNIGKSGAKNLGELPARKSGKLEVVVPTIYQAKAEEVLKAFFKRQRTSVLSALGAKADTEYFDTERWNKELTNDLYALSLTTSAEAGQNTAKAMGFEAADYDVDRTHAFVKAVAVSRAGAVNSTTLDRLQKALDDGDDPGDVFDEAEDTRAGSAGSALMAAVVGFAVVEAGKQLGGDTATKTWNTGANPRAEHAAMDGETVGINDVFSNGAAWPGDPALGAEGVANCNCGVTVSF